MAIWMWIACFTTGFQLEQVPVGWEQLRAFTPPRYSPIFDEFTSMARLEVDPEGTVLALCFEPPANRLFEKLAGPAIQQWRFSPISDDQMRYFELKLVYHGPDLVDTPDLQYCVFEEPFTLHMRSNQLTVRHLPLVNGQVALKKCKRHKIAMSPKPVPIVHGGFRMYEFSTPKTIRETALDWARWRRFPNAPTYAFEGGCMPGPYTLAEVYVCGTCTLNREAWLEKHPWARSLEHR